MLGITHIAFAVSITAGNPPALGAVAQPPALCELQAITLGQLPVAPQWQPGDPIYDVPKIASMPPNAGAAWSNAAIADQAVQRSVMGAGSDFGDLLLQADGQGFNGFSPPDPDGAVGPQHFIQSINGAGSAEITVYNKHDLSIATGPFLLETMGEGACVNGRGDGIVLWDHVSERWLLTEFSTAGDLCVYVSSSADPMTSFWHAYTFDTPEFSDYPKFGIWPDAYYVSANESEAVVYALERDAMLTCDTADWQRTVLGDRGGYSFDTATITDWDGDNPPPPGAPAIVMRHIDDEAHAAPAEADSARDYLELWSLTADFDDLNNAGLTLEQRIPIMEFSSNLCGYTTFSCLPQPFGTNLDPIREVIMWRLQYRNFGAYESLLGNMVSNVNPVGAMATPDPAGVRWFELRRLPGEDTWFMAQQSTWSPDMTHRFMGSIAQDGSGNVALVYNVVDGDSTYPGIRYSGKRVWEMPSLFSEPEHLLVAGTERSSTFRYGDYASLRVDPTDECTFWYTGEYNTSVEWSTRIATFRFPECTGTFKSDLIHLDGFSGPDTLGLNLEVLTNGEDADDPPGPAIAAGDPVDWYYFVQNTGTVNLSQILVTDSHGASLVCPDSALKAGQAMICFALGSAIEGQYSTLGVVTAIAWEGSPEEVEIQDSDPSHYLGLPP